MFISSKYPQAYPVPEWIRQQNRFAFVGERGVGNFLAQDSQQQGINVICSGTNFISAGIAGGPYVWDGKDRIYNMWTEETVDEEAIRKRVDEAHGLGLKVIGELVRMWHQKALYIEHPDWQELPLPDSQPKGPEHYKDWPPVTGCWNSPFGEFYIQQNLELARRLKWDGHSLDGFGCWRCYCPACRSSYEEDTGKQIPPTENLGNVEFRQYLKWRLRRFTAFVDRWQKALKNQNSEYVSIPWISGPGRWWHWELFPNG